MTNPPQNSANFKNRNALIVVAKQPIAGQVKTRLCPPLSAEIAADLAHAFLEDTISMGRGCRGVDVILGYAPFRAESWFEAAFSQIDCVSQGEGDLGARMTRLSATAFERGCERVVLIGADTPFLTSRRVEEAFEALNATSDSVVIGPAEDGGYYLIGMSEPTPELFRDMPWSQESVLSETLNRIQGLGLKVRLLETKRDIDALHDLDWLSQNLERLPEISKTREWFENAQQFWHE